MEYKIYIYATATEFDYFCDRESSTSYNFKIGEFSVDMESDKELVKFLKKINSTNLGIKYSTDSYMSDIYLWDSGESVFLDSNSFMEGFEKYKSDELKELERLVSNREKRAKLKELKLKKSTMTRSEIIKSKINREIESLKKSIY